MDNKIRFYLVGGCVRDELLGHKPNDIDYSVEAHSFEHLKRHLSDNNFEIFVEKPEFGTIKAKCPRTKIVADYTLCRKDGAYSDFRRPDSIELTDIKNDLSRRDFTINAIAKLEHESGDVEYYDPFGGREDLERGIIRCVGSAQDRLSEDPLRGLRALRFSVTKDFEIHPDIIATISTDKFVENFKTLAKERVQVELAKMFQHDTTLSIILLSKLNTEFLEAIFGNDIWLLPTFKKKKRI